MRYKLISFLLFLCFCQSAQGQLNKQYDYTQQNYQSLRYGFFKPDQYDKKKLYPLIIYLHGSRDTVSRDMSWYQPVIQKEHPAFVVTPKCENPDQGWGNTWKAEHPLEMSLALKLVDSLMSVYPIDPNRLYIYGISMGGFGVFSILQKEPGKFAAAYAVCGGSDVKAAGKLMNTPLWIFHGTLDDVVPVHLSRDVYAEMIKLGATNVKYTEYPGVKHNSWENVAQEKTLTTWLFSKRLNQ
ncbi:carboxylesterase family protein [Dyadobacter pollutisoli]|jgi:predicted peptidase|uniref:Prolyl oligopeptidase family serine peptidase n=1 Tax=Dyadobacter pollutisoli TaxID=2910158 RepID=A0A9E8NAQ9_9BACT|nr:prolyl oligopeptidase family serine peptidase [Dyadobacter pollutisoli]WAC13100.1 prolyl oligopeptidase family serine peptidase [Dyadobacter pollutisoli]